MDLEFHGRLSISIQHTSTGGLSQSQITMSPVGDSSHKSVTTVVSVGWVVGWVGGWMGG